MGINTAKPYGRPRIPAHIRAEIKKLRESGMTLKQIAEMHRISIGIVHKILGESE